MAEQEPRPAGGTNPQPEEERTDAGRRVEGSRIRVGSVPLVWVLGILASATGNVILAASDTTEGIHLLQRAAATALVVIGGIQLLNSLMRVLDGHWSSPALKQMLTVELSLFGLLPLAAGVYVFAFAPTYLVLGGFAIALAGACFIFEPLESRIGETLLDEDKRFVTALVASLHWPARLFLRASDTPISTALEKVGDRSLSSAVLWLLTVPTGQLLSRSRLLMTIVLVFATLALAQAPALALVGVETLTAPEERDDSPPAPTKPAGGGQARAGPSKPPTAQSSTTPSTPTVPRREIAEDWEATCPSSPGEDATEAWVEEHIHALYLGTPEGRPLPGADEPPGARAGCTTTVVQTDDAFYSIGVDPSNGQIGSVAITSREFGPSLFIAPAAEPALALILRYGSIGGSRRYRVGNGDFYVVELDVGSVVLVRAQFWDPDRRRVAEGYVQLPTPVAEAWLACMHEADDWLWPAVHHNADGSMTFTLSEDAIARDVRATITYHDTTQVARRVVHGVVRQYFPRGFRLSEGELQALAQTA